MKTNILFSLALSIFFLSTTSLVFAQGSTSGSTSSSSSTSSGGASNGKEFTKMTLDTCESLPGSMGCKSDGTKDINAPNAGVGSFAGKIMGIMLQLLAVFGIAVVVYGGFRWMTSMGNEKGLTAGKNAITNAMIGIVLVLLAYIIVSFVKSIIMSSDPTTSMEHTKTSTVAIRPSEEGPVSFWLRLTLRSKTKGGPESILLTKDAGQASMTKTLTNFHNQKII